MCTHPTFCKTQTDAAVVSQKYINTHTQLQVRLRTIPQKPGETTCVSKFPRTICICAPHTKKVKLTQLLQVRSMYTHTTSSRYGNGCRNQMTILSPIRGYVVAVMCVCMCVCICLHVRQGISSTIDDWNTWNEEKHVCMHIRNVCDVLCPGIVGKPTFLTTFILFQVVCNCRTMYVCM